MEENNTFDTFKSSVTSFLNDFFGAFNPTVLDAIMVTVLLISAVLAFARGFTRETLSLITWVGAFVAALYIHPYLLPYIAPHLGLEESSVLRFVVGAIIFVIFFVALWFISVSLSSIIKSTSISGLDRGLGFLFGIFRGFVVACLVFAAYQQTQKENQTTPDYITNSIFYPTLVWGAKTTIEILPGWANRLKSETKILNSPNFLEQPKHTLENQIGKAQNAVSNAVNTAIKK